MQGGWERRCLRAPLRPLGPLRVWGSSLVADIVLTLHRTLQGTARARGKVSPGQTPLKSLSDPLVGHSATPWPCTPAPGLQPQNTAGHLGSHLSALVLGAEPRRPLPTLWAGGHGARGFRASQLPCSCPIVCGRGGARARLESPLPFLRKRPGSAQRRRAGARSTWAT